MAAYEEKEEKDGESDKEILDQARDYLKECVEAESEERKKMLDDLRFAALDQWPDKLKKDREDDVENGPRPCLVIDKINQYIVQVVNDVRQGRPGINVRPQDDQADIETAKVLKGLIRNIEDQSNADIAYATAVELAAKIGLGYFRITTEYVSDDSFDQEIFIRPIPNTFSVYLGKHLMPDGSDAERGYIVEQIPVEKFKALFPGKKSDPKDFESIPAETRNFWQEEGNVTVVEEFCFEHFTEELLFLADGRTLAKKDYDGPAGAIQDKRLTVKRRLKWRKMTGIEVLEKRDLPGRYIPIVEVVGREALVDGKRSVWGLVRPAKDSLRGYNYVASAIIEKIALAPKQPFIGAVGQFKNLEDRWKTANTKNRPYLEYNAIDINGTPVPPPQRQGAMPMETALVQQLQVLEHDVQTSLGMFKAAVGETESQQSGRAILALQRESDTGTYHFGANLGISIRHAGRIIVDLIPHYYDTARVVRILGEDGTVQTVQLNPEQPQSMVQQQVAGGIQRIYNPSVGKYDVSITVGPSYNTKRMENIATYVEMAKGAADPASAALLRYLVMRNSDAPDAAQAANLFKSLLAPQTLQALDQGEPIPPRAQAQIQQLQAVAQAASQENQELKSGAQEKRAQIAVDREAQAAKLQSDNEARAAQLQADREAAAQKIALERAIAEEKAKLAREVAMAEAALKRETAQLDQQVQMRKVELDREREIAKDPNFKDVAMLPQVNEGIGQLGQAITAAMERLAELQSQSLAVQQETLAFLKAPKKVALSDVAIGPGGEVLGGTVATRTLN